MQTVDDSDGSPMRGTVSATLATVVLTAILRVRARVAGVRPRRAMGRKRRGGISGKRRLAHAVLTWLLTYWSFIQHGVFVPVEWTRPKERHPVSWNPLRS